MRTSEFDPIAAKRRPLLVMVVARLAGLSAGWSMRGFIASDRCLDRGAPLRGPADRRLI